MRIGKYRIATTLTGTLLAGLLLSACAGLAWDQTADGGRVVGCTSGRADAQWPGYDYQALPRGASPEAKAAYKAAYEECYQFANLHPRNDPDGANTPF